MDSDIELKNFYVKCSSCGENLRFDRLDQARVCCKRVIVLSEPVKSYLRRTYSSEVAHESVAEVC